MFLTKEQFIVYHIPILEGMSIDAEGLVRDQDSSGILERPKRIGMGCHPQLMVFPIDPVRRVVHVENALVMRYLWCPELISPGRDERPATLLPVHQIGGMEYRKGPSLGRKGSGPIGIVVALMF
jgi:hypothetical protein